LLPNSVATLNAFTNVENKMMETASRDAIADKESLEFKRLTSTPTELSKENMEISKTSAQKKLRLSTKPSLDSNEYSE